MAVFFYYSIYPLQATGLSVFAITLFICWFAKQIYLSAKKMKEKGIVIKSLPRKFINYLKSEWYQFLGSVAFVCLLLVLFGTHNEFIIPSAIIGSIFLIVFLVMRERKKQKREQEIQKSDNVPACVQS
jgi:uncharacterized membrane protein